MKDWTKAVKRIGVVFFALVLFHIFWPSKMKMEPNPHFISAVRDEDGHILALFGDKTVLNNQLSRAELSQLDKDGELNKFPIVPVLSYEALPESYVYFLTRLENKSFFDVGKDNLYGFSLSGLARLLKGRADGGSNIPQQLLKNAVHKKDGLGTIYLSRKYGEQLAAFQMMKSARPQEILLAYTNYSGNFWYERDFSGLILATYAVFGRPPHELNDLEMLLTVKTLKGAKQLKTLCRNPRANKEQIKAHILGYFELVATGSVNDRKRLEAMKKMDLRFTGTNRWTGGSALSHFLRNQRGREAKDHAAPQYISTLSKARQGKIHKALEGFKKKFAGRLRVNGFELQISLLAIDIETGSVDAILGNSANTAALAHLSDYGRGFQCGSVIKPLVFLELFENYGVTADTQLYNGNLESYSYNPGNVKNVLMDQKVSVGDVLKYSLNKAAVNYRQHADPTEVAKKVEERFVKMGISGNPEYPWGASYILGTRTLTPWEVGQAYQMVFNEGKILPLSPWKHIISPRLQDTIFGLEPAKAVRHYSSEKTNRIKELLSGAFEPGGTCYGLLQWLPKGKSYYGKTGTTGKARDGWTVLSDGKKLLVVWAGYMRIEDGKITRKGAPPIPSRSGGGSAGVLAAMAYSQLYK